MNVAKTYDMLSHALSILSIPDIYSYSLVLNSIELDIGNRIGDASATAAASIHPIGDFLRSRKQNNSFYLRTLPDHFIGNGMVIQINIKTTL